MHALCMRARAQVRDTDIDALERAAACIAWGDLEAEDPRQLSEANFVKAFRLAQLLVEYLLHVQARAHARARVGTCASNTRHACMCMHAGRLAGGG